MNFPKISDQEVCHQNFDDGIMLYMIYRDDDLDKKVHLRKKVPESSPSHPSLLFEHDLNRFLICILSLQHETLYLGKVLPDTEG